MTAGLCSRAGASSDCWGRDAGPQPVRGWVRLRHSETRSQSLSPGQQSVMVSAQDSDTGPAEPDPDARVPGVLGDQAPAVLWCQGLGEPGIRCNRTDEAGAGPARLSALALILYSGLYSRAQLSLRLLSSSWPGQPPRLTHHSWRRSHSPGYNTLTKLWSLAAGVLSAL